MENWIYQKSDNGFQVFEWYVVTFHQERKTSKDFYWKPYRLVLLCKMEAFLYHTRFQYHSN